jgi:opacity protein-like surface antigen
VTRNISIKAEYRYSDYGTGNLFTGTPDFARPGLSLSTLRAGVNYHF